MSDYNWCHGPICHKSHTQDRIRGVKGSKVLRTRKIKTYNGNQGFYNWFCSQSCERDFCNKYTQQIIAIAPRTEALETPIEVTKETVDTPYWGRRVETRIKEIDNGEQVG
jgi:hypothetical protein